MISLEIIDGEIASLHDKEPTYVVVEKLAALYTVRDHIIMEEKKEIVSLPESMNSEFIAAVRKKPTLEPVFVVLDELMETLKILEPKLYNGVMARLS